MGLLYGLGVIIICSNLAVYSHITVLFVTLLLLSDSMSLTFIQAGATALLLAAGEGHLEVVRVLTKGGAEVDTQNRVGCPTVFFLQMLIFY